MLFHVTMLWDFHALTDERLQFKKFERRRSDQNDESIEEDFIRPDLGVIVEYRHNEESTADDQRRASEPTTVTRAMLLGGAVSQQHNQRHASIAGSTYQSSVSQVTRASNAKTPPSSDPLGLTLVHDSDRPSAA